MRGRALVVALVALALLTGCSSGAAEGVEQVTPQPSSALEPTEEPSPTEAPSEAPSAVHYGSCDAAKEAGAAPLRRGDAGYSRKLDRDGDGIACEN